jgi:hypothetical protein
MGFYVLVQPDEKSSVDTVEHSFGHPSLIIDSDGSAIAFQIASQPDGALLAARFARLVADTALKFAARCDELTRMMVSASASGPVTFGQANGHNEITRSIKWIAADRNRVLPLLAT